MIKTFFTLVVAIFCLYSASGQVTAHFNWNNPCAGSAVLFNDSSTNGATSWQWNFGDAGSGTNTSTSRNPTHIYTKSGSYKVKLIVTKGGNSDSLTRTVVIYSLPVIKRSTGTTICIGNTVRLFASGGSKYLWSPSSYLSDTTKDSIWAFPMSTTTYSVKVFNSAGCYASDTVNISVDSTSTSCQPKGISGVINNYAKVIAINSCPNAFDVDSSSFFKVGSRVLIIQMKGAVADSSNTSNFGKVIKYNSAGLYEKATIKSISGKTIYFNNTLVNTYDPKSFVQVITIPQYKSVKITNTLIARGWSKLTGKGGVLVFEASGTVFLNGNNIDVSGKGFSGGSASTNMIIYDCKTLYSSYHYAYNKAPYWGAQKGESYITMSDTMNGGRGAAASGGGGGNNINSGGAGGGNFGNGGAGGKTYYCGGQAGGAAKMGGIGGLAFNYISSARIFPGSGGGGGHQNNSSGTNGKNGGGIIMISSNSLQDNGAILSNGLDQTGVAGNDGAGGGGAGGTVLLDISNNYSSATIEIHGGKGGSYNDANCYGPGGGGGGGVLLTKSTNLIPSTNIDTSGGAPGHNTNSSATCYLSSYGADTGNTGGVIKNLKITESAKLYNNFTGILPSDTTICIGDSAHLYGSSATSYTWSPSGTISNPNSANTWAHPFKTTYYKLTIKNSSACIASDSFKVSVSPLPKAYWTVKPDSGRTYTFSASDSTLSYYSWNFGDSLSASGVKANHTFKQNKNYTATLTVKNTAGCINTHDSTFTVITDIALPSLMESGISVQPNPFKEKTRIEFELSQAQTVKIELTGIDGKSTCIFNSYKGAGKHFFDINSDRYGLSEGIYILKIYTPDKVNVRKIIKVN